jgi:hypothetical protein
MKKEATAGIGIMLILATLFISGATGADDTLMRLIGLENRVNTIDARLKVLEDMHGIIPPDKCNGITCEDTTTTCWDGYQAKCTNTCTNGVCSTCIPDCTGHTNPCEGITCQDSNKICPDGYNSKCSNTCQQGICSSCIPSCVGHENNKAIVILQMDDLQAWWLEKESAIVVDGLIARQIPVTLGVVPAGMNERDGVKGGIVENLKNWTKNYPQYVESAVHTYDHDDYSGWSLSQQVSDIKKGKAMFDTRGIPTWTFVPANSWGNSNTPNAIVQSGLLIGLDGLENPYIDSYKNPMILEDGAFYGYGYSWDYNKITSLIDNNWKERGYYVLGFHQQDLTFSSSRTTFFGIIDKLKASGKYRFMTAKQYYDYKNGGA